MFDEFINSFLTGDIISALLILLLTVVIGIVKAILFPLSYLINQFIPPLSQGLQAISDMFNMASTSLSWALQLVMIPSTVILIIVGYYSFVLSTTLIIWGVKIGILWRRSLK